MNTKELLKNLKKAILNNDPKLLLDHISHLINKQPDNWKAILCINKLILNLEDGRFKQNCLLIIEAKKLCKDSNVEIALSELGSVLFLINSKLQRIKDKLKQIDFDQISISDQLFNLGRFIEFQHNEISKKIYGQPKDKIIDLRTAINTTQPSSVSTGGFSLAGICEGLWQCADLIIRNALYKSRSKGFGNLNYSTESKDISQVIILARVWLDLNYVFSQFVFNNWQLLKKSTDFIFVPKMPAIFDITNISDQRWNLFFLNLPIFVIKDLNSCGDAEWRIKKLARKIDVPQIGQEWDCEIQSWELDKAVINTIKLQITDWFLSKRFYGKIVDRLKVDTPDGTIVWDMWLKIWNALDIISKAYERAVQNKNQENYLSNVAIIRIANLAKTVSNAIKVDTNICLRYLKFMVFDQARKKINIFSQPLLPISADLHVLVPNLIHIGNPILAIEDFIYQFDLKELNLRGHFFENYIESIFKSQSDLKAKANVVSSIDQTEYDLIIVWQDFIFLCEVKCLKSVYEPGDEWNARKEILYSVEQLKKRKKDLSLHWNAIRKDYPILGLGTNPPIPEKIKCISVSNLMLYSGWQIDDVIVTDDLIVKSFFDPATIASFQARGDYICDIKYVDKIRGGKDKNPLGFWEYLLDPPQINSVRKGIKDEYRSIPDFEDERRIAFKTYSVKLDSKT